MAPCRNGTNRTLKGRCIALKREDRVLGQQQQSNLIAKQRSHKPRYRRTCRRIWNQGCKETTNPTEMSKEQLRRIAKVMHEFHLPYSLSESHGENSLEGLPQFLRWSIDENLPRWTYLKYGSERKEPLRTRSSFQIPTWTQVPTCPSHLGILTSVSRFERSCLLRSPIHIPLDWPVSTLYVIALARPYFQDQVFEGVMWSELEYLRSLGMTDSSDIGRVDACALQVEEPWLTKKLDFGLGIHCRVPMIVLARLRSFWTLFAAMNPDRFNWRLQTKERALRRHERRHVGFLDLNQATTNHDLWPQKAMEALLSIWEPEHEMGFSLEVGRVVTNAVATSMFPAQSRQNVRWPAVFNQAGKPPVIDYTCRVRQDVMGWREDLCPLIFAAQYGTGDQKHAIEQLSKAFQPMMTLFILYYLDCRTSRNQSLPSWMVLFGVVFNESGLTIRAHHPCFDPPQTGTKSSRTPGWGSSSRSMGNDCRDFISDEPSDRGSVIAALNRIQGHCIHVIQMLQAWSGYDSAVSRLQI